MHDFLRNLPLPVCLVLGLLIAAPCAADEGVIEINHAAALAGGVSTSEDNPGYPISIWKGGSYRVVGDLQPDSPNLFEINASAGIVEIDLNGHTLSGNVTTLTGFLIQNLPRRVVIRNGTLKSFSQAAINASGTTTDIVVEDVEIASSEFGISLGESFRQKAVLRRVWMRTNGNAVMACSNLQVTDSLFEGNTESFTLNCGDAEPQAWKISGTDIFGGSAFTNACTDILIDNSRILAEQFLMTCSASTLYHWTVRNSTLSLDPVAGGGFQTCGALSIIDSEIIGYSSEQYAFCFGGALNGRWTLENVVATNAGTPSGSFMAACGEINIIDSQLTNASIDCTTGAGGPVQVIGSIMSGGGLNFDNVDVLIRDSTLNNAALVSDTAPSKFTIGNTFFYGTAAPLSGATLFGTVLCNGQACP